MDLYTTKQAAEYLGITERTIKVYLKDKKLIPFRQIGRSWVFTREELDRVAALPRHAGGRPKKPRDEHVPDC